MHIHTVTRCAAVAETFGFAADGVSLCVAYAKELVRFSLHVIHNTFTNGAKTQTPCCLAQGAALLEQGNPGAGQHAKGNMVSALRLFERSLDQVRLLLHLAITDNR